MGAALLLAQSAFVFRGHLAQAVPELRQPLQQACATLGCTMPAVRALASLSVQASSLSYDDDSGHHRLRVLLGNSGALPAAMPALELTLLDGPGQVLARRVLLPSDFDVQADSIDPQGSREASLKLDLKAIDAGAISSFRALPFYP